MALLATSKVIFETRNGLSQVNTRNDGGQDRKIIFYLC